MPVKKILILIYCILGYLSGITADNNIFYFSNLNLKDGLSQLSVLKVCEDSKGYIWLATRNGLNRYDGENFVVYKHDNDNQNSLTDNHITTLLPDRKNHGLWVGTTNGLNYIDLSNNKITRYNKETVSDLAGNDILSLCMDHMGRVWVGTRTGLNCFVPAQNKWMELNLSGKPGKEAITALYIDNNDHLLIGTQTRGLFVYDQEMNLLDHFSTATNPTLSANMISSIFEDSKKQLWLGTNTGGINKCNIKTREIVSFTKSNSLLVDNDVRCFEELNGNLIIGTFEGLSILDLKTDLISKYNNFDVREGSLNHFSVYSLFTDRVGTLWVGTYSGGVSYYNPLNNRFTFYHPQNEPHGLFGIFGYMVYQPEGTLWMATEGGGLLEFDPQKKSFRNYLMEEASKGMYSKNIVKSLLLEGELILCGTNQGVIYRFNTKSRTFSPYFDFKNVRNLGIYSLFRDDLGNLWAGTTAEKGLCMITPGGEVINEFPVQGDSSVHFSSVRCFLELRKGVYLIGTRSSGLFKYDTIEKTIERYHTSSEDQAHHLQSNYISTILCRANGNIWIGTFGGGIYQYEEKKGIIKHLETSDGLIDNNVCAMVESEHTIWISAGPGISELSTESYRFRNYNRFSGIEVREFTPQGGICLPNGDIYFSGSNGFLSFNTASLIKNKYIPPVVFTRLSVNNKEIEPDDPSGLLTSVIDDTDKMVLQYDQNNFSIAYSALNYMFHQQNQYAYRLLGHDKEWIRVGTRKEAFYTNIAPGEYTFQVIASNNDGLWNEEGKSIRIIILPPWWKTPLAYILYALTFFTICFVFWYYRRSKRKLEEDLRIKQFEKQTLEEFHQTKVRLFTNFSHELRTPLTLIISPLGELMSHIGLNSDLKQKVNLISRNAERLLLLVNQLMDLQKEQSGNMQLKVEKEDINTFLQEIYLAFRQIAESKQVDFRYEAFSGSDPVPVYFDRSLMEKVVFNLLSNAFKFTSAGESVVMSLDIYSLENPKEEYKDLIPKENSRGDSQNFFVIRVADTGKGIPDMEKQHIFTPFYQVEDDQSSNVNGTGIGLSLTHSIVGLHNGMIGLKDNFPKGSVFTVIIPMDKSAYTEEQLIRQDQEILVRQENTGSGITMEVTTTSPKTILLVEDSEDIRNYIKESLSPYFKVIEADNGMDAFDLTLQYFPDLIISDIMMPKMDGLEFCSLVKTDLRTGHIPVILLTARTMVMQMKEGFVSGADDYIVKPFDIDILLVRINNLLSLRDKLKTMYGKKFSLEEMGIQTSSADDRFMQKFFDVIEKYLSDPELNVELICKELGFSRANFYRKLKAITELSPAELIRNKRLEIAARILCDTDMNVSEVSERTGFSTPAYFARCFKLVYGMSPSEYVQSHRKPSETGN